MDASLQSLPKVDSYIYGEISVEFYDRMLIMLYLSKNITAYHQCLIYLLHIFALQFIMAFKSKYASSVSQSHNVSLLMSSGTIVERAMPMEGISSLT